MIKTFLLIQFKTAAQDWQLNDKVSLVHNFGFKVS